MVKFIKNLQFIFNPTYWMLNNRYSKEWDDLLNYLMDNFEPVLGKPNIFSGEIYTVKFDTFSVWISNYPYAYATPYEVPFELKDKYYGNLDVRPSKLTILRLHRLINELARKEVKNNSIETGFIKVLEGYLEEDKKLEEFIKNEK